MSPPRPTTSTAASRSPDRVIPDAKEPTVNDEIADRPGQGADHPAVPERTSNTAAGEPPPVRVEPDARRRIRRALAEAGRRIAVLDDDPTGSQTVHDVDVVTVFEPDEIAAGLTPAGATCFILTNTRSLPEADAVELNTRIGRMLFELADRPEAPEVIVGRRSRSRLVLRGGAGPGAGPLGRCGARQRPPSPSRCSGRNRQARRLG